MEIVKVCTSQGSLGKNPGCEKAPEAILDELKKIETNESGKKIEFKVSDSEINENDLDETYKSIENTTGDVVLGGDHSISYPIVKAFAKIEENPLLIVFDAHVDCLDSGKIPNNRGWLRKLIEEGFNSSKIILISTRNIFSEEIEFLEKN